MKRRTWQTTEEYEAAKRETAALQEKHKGAAFFFLAQTYGGGCVCPELRAAAGKSWRHWLTQSLRPGAGTSSGRRPARGRAGRLTASFSLGVNAAHNFVLC